MGCGRRILSQTVKTLTDALVAHFRHFGNPLANARQPPRQMRLQAGALCPTGTVSVLKLSGPKVQQWLDLVEKYNATVEGATRTLKADARNILTPAQMAELDRWMEKGLNPEVNRLLASRSR
jgi:hypothetical protein